jgi:hypothetical protein
MEINNQNGLVAAYSFPYSIVKGTAVNLAPANIVQVLMLYHIDKILVYYFTLII